jgi:uncharacterized protein (TIGR03086 family)
MSFTKSAVLPVSPDEAFALLTDPERLRRWQAVSAYVDLRAGGEYRWTITAGHVAAGTYREVEPGRRIVFGWGWDGNPDVPPDGSTVTLTIEPIEGGSLVTLVHDGLTGEQAARHAEGWNHYFERLEKLAATGDAGPDEWAWMIENPDPVKAADAALAVIQPVLRGLTTADRGKPTPCAGFTCHDLVEHLFSSLVRLGAMAGATVVNPSEGSLENRVSVMAAQATDGWRSRGLGGSVEGPDGQRMPASFAASVLPVELILHGWDLAQGSGQQMRASDDLVAYLRELAEVVVPAARPGGSFAPRYSHAPMPPPSTGSPRTPVVRHLHRSEGQLTDRTDPHRRSTGMAKYVFIYHAPMPPADAAPPSRDEMDAVMQEWNAWAAKVGDRMIDFGAPLAGGRRVTTEGTSDSERQVVGYSILEADDFDAALELARDHPHLNMPGGCEIEVHQAQPIPGM